ncbi:beta-phosphoglucomutase [Candidatus Enterococcus clewellii]|uniref:Beta-phosphoglucomutase n=1 Tax=Candidatus Enterococcus clewellii TaxID=1834193 RepID=A0A242K2K8_9ENTE|nr:beta-phosphoglucomutase [Enterococcus sp. 9E7_DIV0242]OTP12828.1 beta-phosphoglucomutase [Enterococcus sp. 9E7_DIV0242]
METMKGAIFDLDGVLVDTAKYHYLAWKKLANQLGFDFTEEENEQLKGVSRVRSLEILLELGGIEKDELEQSRLREMKNDWYLTFIKDMTEDELLKGAKEYLLQLKKEGVKISLGSASKNAVSILKSLNIYELFDVIIDGTKVTNAKPDPEVFLKAAQGLGLSPEDCIVFEDAQAGVQAGKAAGMYVIGIGTKENLPEADKVVAGLYELVK